jgi:NitT/TauT family transport system substrate-binding protein
MTLRRRTLVQAGAAATAAATLAGFATAAFAQARTKLRVGYLHTPAVDGQIWLGQQSGAWTKRGLDLELVQFTTGLELFQAMIGGSLDVLSTGRGGVELSGARPGPRLPAQQHRVRDRAALGPRRRDQVDRRPQGQADLDHDRHDGARLPRPRAALGQARPDQGRAARQPAHGRGGDLVRLGRGAGGGALGAFDQTVRRRCGARKIVDASAFFPRGRDHGRLGRPQRLLRLEQGRRSPRSSPAGSRPTTRCSPTSTPRPRRCRRRSTRTCRSPTSRSR